MNIRSKYFSSGHFPAELFDLFVGEKLGNGIARDVYAHAYDPDLVIKFEASKRSFSNVVEWELWNRVQDTAAAKWFAPCEYISPCGAILIQKRTKPVSHSELPKRIPHFFTDLKAPNWGRLGDRIVCHDYGLHLMHERGMSVKLVKADWRESS